MSCSGESLSQGGVPVGDEPLGDGGRGHPAVETMMSGAVDVQLGRDPGLHEPLRVLDDLVNEQVKIPGQHRGGG